MFAGGRGGRGEKKRTLEELDSELVSWRNKDAKVRTSSFHRKSTDYPQMVHSAFILKKTLL